MPPEVFGTYISEKIIPVMQPMAGTARKVAAAGHDTSRLSNVHPEAQISDASGLPMTMTVLNAKLLSNGL